MCTFINFIFMKNSHFVLKLSLLVSVVFIFSACQPKTADKAPAQTPVDSKPTEDQTGVAFVNKLIEAIKTKNYNLLESEMMDSVEVVKVGSTACCGTMGKAEAIKQLSFLDLAKGSWNFDSLSAPIVGLRNTYPQYFNTTGLIGIAENGIIVGFEINTDPKIVKIVMAGSYKVDAPK